MKTIDDGGPAFPCEAQIDGTGAPIPHTQMSAMFPGMSLRDWFAAQALTGFVAHGPHPDLRVASEEALVNMYVSASYSLADAMILRRKEGHQ